MDAGERMPIGVFARVTGVAPSALRFYDDCGLVRPATVDAATGYRWYSAEQVDEVLLIRQLREAGLPLPEVRRVLVSSADVAHDIIAEHLQTMEQAVERARTTASLALDVIRSRRQGSTTLPGRLLADGIGQVAPAADAGGAIPVLAGVLFELVDHELRLVASDRYRLAVRSIAIGGRPRHLPPTVAPADDLQALRPWIAQQERIEVGVSGGDLRLVGRTDERTLTPIAETYPRYHDVLAGLPTPTTQVIVARRALLAALGEDPEARLGLTIDSDVRVRSSTGLMPAAVIPADVTGAPVAVSFRHTTLHPAVAAAVGPDVMLQITEPDQPVVIRAADDGDLTVVAMPVSATT